MLKNNNFSKFYAHVLDQVPKRGGKECCYSNMAWLQWFGDTVVSECIGTISFLGITFERVEIFWWNFYQRWIKTLIVKKINTGSILDQITTMKTLKLEFFSQSAFLQHSEMVWGHFPASGANQNKKYTVIKSHNVTDVFSLHFTINNKYHLEK